MSKWLYEFLSASRTLVILETVSYATQSSQAITLVCVFARMHARVYTCRAKIGLSAVTRVVDLSRAATR